MFYDMVVRTNTTILGRFFLRLLFQTRVKQSSERDDQRGWMSARITWSDAVLYSKGQRSTWRKQPGSNFTLRPTAVWLISPPTSFMQKSNQLHYFLQRHPAKLFTHTRRECWEIKTRALFFFRSQSSTTEVKISVVVEKLWWTRSPVCPNATWSNTSQRTMTHSWNQPIIKINQQLHW